MALPSLSKTMTPSAMPSKMAWLLLASGTLPGQSEGQIAGPFFYSAVKLQIGATQIGQRVSRLRADSQDTRATAKKPSMGEHVGHNALAQSDNCDQ